MVSKRSVANLSIASLLALAARFGAGEQKPFQPGAAARYAHQASENVTVGAKSFDNPELAANAFGKKTDFAKYGVLPVLVVIENKRDQTLDLRHLEVTLVASDGRHAAAVAPDDLPFLATAGKYPSQNPVHVGLPVPLPKKKNPLNTPEISARAFSAKMLPAGDSASGFFYFEAKPERDDKLYVSGLLDARSGQELLYFEFPLVD